MNYISKRKRKILKKIKRTSEGDDNKRPYSTADEVLGRKLTLLSRGEKIERSHKKRVGDIINKDLDKRFMTYKVLEKAMKRIDTIRGNK